VPLPRPMLEVRHLTTQDLNDSFPIIFTAITAAADGREPAVSLNWFLDLMRRCHELMDETSEFARRLRIRIEDSLAYFKPW